MGFEWNLQLAKATWCRKKCWHHISYVSWPTLQFCNSRI